MANSELVTEFRSRVDIAINRQVEEAQAKGNVIPWMLQRANTGGLAFVSIGPKEDTPYKIMKHMEYAGERLWAISDDRLLNIGGYVARLAVISTDKNPDILIRRLEFPQFYWEHGAITKKELSESMKITDALNWARSPNATEKEMSRLAQLADQEVSAMDRAATTIDDIQRRQTEVSTPDWSNIKLGDIILS
jgi:PHD/YefM family antitoxin component YafN of YafNO toxin-antitoxin module